jgi:hypothetical protein
VAWPDLFALRGFDGSGDGAEGAGQESGGGAFARAQPSAPPARAVVLPVSPRLSTFDADVKTEPRQAISIPDAFFADSKGVLHSLFPLC